ncbi:MAG TPA: DUF4097 family beta strand repeat-containing protein [Vicinamibacteria bacterium]
MKLLAPAILAALALSACDPHRVEERSVEEFRFETGSARPKLEVRIESGSVEIVGTPDSRSVEAEFAKRARSVDRESAKALLERAEVSAAQVEAGTRFRFEGRVESVTPFGGDLRTDLRIRVPREIDLEISTEDGRVEIEGTSGRVSAESGDGRIVVKRISGELHLRTEDGSIVGQEIQGALEAATDDGGIELEGTFPRLEAVSSDGSIRVDCLDWPAASMEGWVLRTADGAIRVVLPASAAADIDATTSDGHVVNRLHSFEGTSHDENGRRIRGKLAGGGPLLFLSTMDGRIELSQK